MSISAKEQVADMQIRWMGRRLRCLDFWICYDMLEKAIDFR